MSARTSLVLAGTYYSWSLDSPTTSICLLYFYLLHITEWLYVNFHIAHASWAASWLLLNMSFSHDFFLGLCSSPPICIACLSSLLSKLFRILPLRVSFHLQLQNGIFCVFSWLSWWVCIEQLAYLCKHTRCPQPGLAAAIPGAVESTPVSLTAWGLPRCAQGRGGGMQRGRETWGFRLVHFPGIFWGR